MNEKTNVLPFSGKKKEINTGAACAWEGIPGNKPVSPASA
jgi:hypothetical protein